MKYALFTLGICGLSFMVGCGGKKVAQNPAPAPAAPQPVTAEPLEELAKPKTTNLMDAAAKGNVNDVKFYLRSDPAALKRPNENGMYPIHRAADNGRLEVVQLLLKAGADVNTPHATVQATPLQYAASGGHVEVVRTLLDAKANVNATDSTGRTPLMWAATNGQAAVVELLLARGADANQKTSAGWTALKYAEQKQHPEVAELLRKQTAAAP